MRARWIISWAVLSAAPLIAAAQVPQLAAPPAAPPRPEAPVPPRHVEWAAGPVVGAQVGEIDDAAFVPAVEGAPQPRVGSSIGSPDPNVEEKVMTESQDAPTPADPPLTRENSDVAFWGGFTAKEIRWKIVPNVKVRTYGSKGVASQWTGERVNLPKPVKREETYRNAGGNFEILTRLPDEKSITYSTTFEPAPPAGVTPARAAQKVDVQLKPVEANEAAKPPDGRIPPPRPPKRPGGK